MKQRFAILLSCSTAMLASCATTSDEGTLAELINVEPDTSEIQVADSLDRAAESYRRYLAETPEGQLTPEAMRRLADLQIEQEYGVISGDVPVEMAAPELAARTSQTADSDAVANAPVLSEDDREFEERASSRQALLTADRQADVALTDANGAPIPTGPMEAIATYQKILEKYPNYERNDQVLYQMSRAYDEIGQPDDAMQVMDRLISEYPYSQYIDEVQFRRGEYFFVRKQYLDAEDAYGAIIDMGSTTSYYELALYKLGWTLYKQELYEDALDRYVAMLDYRHSTGYDFDEVSKEDPEHRIADTFRVVSLCFSNMGDAGVIDDYFAVHGQRSYAHRIYQNLGEFFFSKLRYEDAASVYKSFVGLNPTHRESPHFSMRVIDIYFDAGFPLRVVEAKKAFATDYAFGSEYWNHFDKAQTPEVVAFLKTNLTDLANHYHALYQDEEFVDQSAENFAEAANWYQQILASFPGDEETPGIHYQLADLLLEDERFADAAREYERTAYGYTEHEQAPAAGYAAVYAYREELKVVTGAAHLNVRNATVDSSLKFAESFPEHEQAAVVLGAAADDLYEMKALPRAIDAATWLVERYPESDADLRRSAWAVVAHASLDLTLYLEAEHAYQQVLGLTPEDDETRPAIIDGLAASIYKQGEQASLLEDHRTASEHYLRIKEIAPTSSIRASAEYDAAASLMVIEDWTMASEVLEDFRLSHPEDELATDATRQLAHVYRQDGQISRAAAEHERIAVEATDPELAREALLTAAELYDEAQVVDEAVRVYEQYVVDYPRPLDIALETRTRLADIHKDRLDYSRYHAELAEIVTADREAGADRTDRSRFLAAGAALVLTELDFNRFAEIQLIQPFEESLESKQQQMDFVLEQLNTLVGYQVADVTAAATFYIAETYQEFSRALMESERPAGLSEVEKLDYELVLEDEAYPFEEKALDVHEANVELLVSGVYNTWVQKSLDELAVLMPGRYAKNEISGGYIGSINSYAYRMPIAPGITAESDGTSPDTAAIEASAQISPEPE